MCFDEFTELETEKKIAKEVIKQALKDYPKKPLTPQRSSVLAGRSPARTPKKERNQNQEVGQQDSLEKENIGNTSTPSRPALRTPPASPHPNLQDSVDGFLPSSAILAHQSFAPPRPPLHHDATPDRRRKEAILRVKGTPTHHPMSRWSLEKSQER